MISRLDPRILAYAPDFPGGAPLVAAAVRAGALGFLDLGRLDDREASIAEAVRLTRMIDRPFGVRVDGTGIDEGWLREFPDSLGFVICVEDSRIDWPCSISAIVRGRSGPLGGSCFPAGGD